ncbi:MAG TPA: hypothetical protein DET40_06630 [Lentisphaeria bacterium]|nr:MAG: hypothetical protein A2X45_17495 [Lentisphaerae bacterium GWF2_50_93]HCE43204.1 hypothetical protein [Lentisphaeria bacterium]
MADPNPHKLKLAHFLVMFIHLCAALPFIYLSILLLIHAETTGGLLVGAGTLLLIIFTFSMWLPVLFRFNKKTMIPDSILLFSGIACFTASYFMSPTGSSTNTGFSQKFHGQTHFSRAGITNIVPEIDQLKLGTYVFRYLPVGIDEKQMNRLRTLVLDVYHELIKEENFKNAGSALGMCYEDIFLGKRSTLHFYEYVPRQLKKDKYPVMIFLHGSLGNFIGYTWVLKKVADTAGVAIVSPTYGCGNWYLDPECMTIGETFEYCRANKEFDMENAYLACLSNGGTGLTREIMLHGGKYKGFIIVSAVLEENIYNSSEFLSNIKSKPVLILQGEKDDRIPLDNIREFESVISESLVTSRYFPEEDHFLMFSKRNEMAEIISKWFGNISEKKQ